MNDKAKVGPSSINPNYNFHYVYDSYSLGDIKLVCLLEIDGPTITDATDTESDVFAIWLFGINLLESDYNDLSSTYPVAPIVSNVKAYGLPSALAFTSIGEINNSNLFLETVCTSTSNQSGTSARVPYITGQMKTAYYFYMAPIIMLTNISGQNVTSNDPASRPNLLIPVYCPLAKATSNVGVQFNVPQIISTWFRMSSYSNITYTTALLKDTAGNIQYGRPLAMQKTRNQEGTYRIATLMFKKYSANQVADKNLLDIYNGSYILNGTNIKCSGFIFFFTNLIVMDNTVTKSLTVNSLSTSLPQYAKPKGLFYVFGKPFTQALLISIGTNAPITIPPSGNPLTTIVATFLGVLRPILASYFVPGANPYFSAVDNIAFACSSSAGTENEVLTNYMLDNLGVNRLANFMVDYNPDISAVSTGIKIKEDNLEIKLKVLH